MKQKVQVLLAQKIFVKRRETEIGYVDSVEEVEQTILSLKPKTSQ